nr:MAG TPA: hypothetical protein [Caudoviricetes sp.]
MLFSQTFANSKNEGNELCEAVGGGARHLNRISFKDC